MIRFSNLQKYLFVLCCLAVAAPESGHSQQLDFNKIHLVDADDAPSGPSGYMSLQGAIHTALHNNSKTKSKDMQLEALRASTEAAHDRLYPRFYLSCGITKSTSQSELENKYYPARSVTQDCRVSVSYTLYDGGAAYYNYKAAENQTLATEQRFKSTNILLQNTYGSLAKNTLSSYLSLSGDESQIEFFKRLVVYLQKLISVAQVPKDISNLNNFLAEVQRSLSLVQSTYETEKDNFQYVVTVPAPPQIDNLDQIIQSLIIPPSADAAYEIALQKSPDLKATDAQLESSKDRVLAARAETRPQVSVELSRGRDRYRDQLVGINSSNTYSNSVSLNVNIPLDPANYANLKASQKSAAADQFERDSALEDLKHNLKSTYSMLQTQNEQIISIQKDYSSLLASVDDAMKKIDQRQKVDVETVYGQVTALFSVYEQYLQAQNMVISYRFNIQQVAGTLFDIVEQTQKVRSTSQN